MKSNKIKSKSFDVNSELKVATLVCKRWNEIISTSVKIMSGFTLKVTDKSINVLTDPIVKRRYSCCEFYNVENFNHEQYLEIMRVFADISSITFFENIPCKDQNCLLEFCRNNLENLKFYNTNTGRNHQALKYLQITSFPKLKSLSIINRPQSVSRVLIFEFIIFILM